MKYKRYPPPASRKAEAKCNAVCCQSLAHTCGLKVRRFAYAASTFPRSPSASS